MANTIKLKRGTSTPSTSDISNGEVAIDTSAKKLYVNDSGTVKEIGGSGSVGGASGLDFNDDVKVRFGTGNDLELFHDGSNSYIKDTGTGELRLASDSNTRITKGDSETCANFTPDGASELYYDNSKKLQTNSTGIQPFGNVDVQSAGHVLLEDDGRLKLGNSQDIQIWHSNSDSNITNATGDFLIQCTGDDINIKAADDIRLKPQGDESGVLVYGNAGVEIYYDNSKKFETTSYGNASAGQVRVTSSNATTPAFSVGDSGTGFYNTGTNAIGYSANGTQKWNINNEGNLRLFDNAKLQLGSSGDCEVFHDGTGCNIRSTSSKLEIRSPDLLLQNSGAEKYFRGVSDGAVELYYDNAKKFETTSGGVQVEGNLVANSGYIHVSGSDLYIDDTYKAKFGAGSDLQVYHNASHSFVDHSGTGNLIINGNTSNNVDIMKGGHSEYMARFKPDNAVELYYDNSKKFFTVSGGAQWDGDLYGLDNDRLSLGSGNDLLIYHNGSHSYALNTTGQFIIGGDTVMIKDGGNSEVGLKYVKDGAVVIYYDDSQKLTTSSSGIEVSGNVHVNDSDKFQCGNSADLKIYHDGTTNIIEGTNNTLSLRPKTGENGILIVADNATSLYYDDSKKFETTSSGATVTGTFLATSNIETSNHITLLDDKRLKCGAGHDLQVWHSGSHNYIQGATSGQNLYIQNTNGSINIEAKINESSIWCGADGDVELYYDNSKKFETNSSGLEVFGRLGANRTSQLVNESSISADSGGNTCCFRATGSSGHNPLMLWNNHTSGNRSQIQFADGSSYSARGSITTNGSNTSFNTSSDYRLKQDDVLITDGLTKVNALKPKRFKWKDNLSIGICDGFFAHEVQEAAPTSGATIGTKDEVDDDGKPVYQSIDQSKLVPLLTAAIQELSAEINTLKTKVTALEAA